MEKLSRYISQTMRPIARGLATLFVTVIGANLLVSCASLPKPKPEWNVRTEVETTNTSWARALAPAMAQHPGWSGLHLLPHGQDAYAARLALADTAEKTLDIQYYIWKPDDSGRVLADRLRAAADRGVRVRLLLDDLGGSTTDSGLLILDNHTNIEVRLFNPVANRTFRRLSIAVDFRRITRRMHNKSFTADGRVTLLGGRNVEDRYFAVGDEPQFADYDLLAAGPVAEDVSTMFDNYWFCSASIPIAALAKGPANKDEQAESYAALAAQAQAVTNRTRFQEFIENPTSVELRRYAPALVWGPTRLVADLPEKVASELEDNSTHMMPEVRRVANESKRELIVVSPYFIPGDRGVEFFVGLRKRGIRVIILSNSLASNDATAMHVGYRRYRKALLRAGVEMWELKPDAKIRASIYDGPHEKPDKRADPGASLHAKVFLFDRESLFVGSPNLDPHSTVLNTEMGVIADVPSLAAQMSDSIESQLPHDAYRLEFVPSSGGCKECGSIVWISQENDKEVRYTSEPQAPFSRKLLVFLLSFLPIESQL